MLRTDTGIAAAVVLATAATAFFVIPKPRSEIAGCNQNFQKTHDMQQQQQ